MKKEELIKKMQALPNGVEVCIMDYQHNFSEDSGEGSGVGIYKDFDVQYMGKKDIVDGTKPFAVLCFDKGEDNGH